MIATLVLSALIFAAPPTTFSSQTQLAPQNSLYLRPELVCYRSAAENSLINDDLSKTCSAADGTIDDAPPQSGNITVKHDAETGRLHFPADADSGVSLSR
jgi:hypothetical protein